MTKKEKSYHRDDLRGDLLRAGRAYISEHGHHSLTVRTLAQTVGVSPGAPYHHFRDRRALLLALARDGYEELTQKAVAAASSPGSAEQKLIALAMNFVDFAMTSPQLLELMYESELTSPSPDVALLEYQNAGQSALLGQLRIARPDDSDDEAGVRVLALWSSIYGFASLRRKQMIQKFEPQHMGPDEVARRTMTLAVHAALED